MKMGGGGGVGCEEQRQKLQRTSAISPFQTEQGWVLSSPYAEVI